MTEQTTSLTVRRLGTADMPALYDLRGRVLRPGMPPEASLFPGDDQPGTIHLGAFTDEGRLVGIATLVRNEGLQLRGMATEPDVRGTGAGAALLREAHRIAQESGEPLWCNARVVAVGFYERMGWRTEGEEFDVPTVGPHYIMRWQCGR
jgi:predicted GNAT family N-acyltransferase